MKTKMVRRGQDEIPPISEQRLAEMRTRALGAIDVSDIPEWSESNFARAVRGRFYRPVKQQVTAKVDADVVAWLKAQGPGYQTRMNAILRKAMLEALEARNDAA